MTPLTATILGIAAVASLEALRIARATAIRLQGELGAAIATGFAAAVAVGSTHAALVGGVLQTVPFGTDNDVLLFAGGGYASSLDANADGRRVAGLSGGFVMVEAGIRF